MKSRKQCAEATPTCCGLGKNQMCTSLNTREDNPNFSRVAHEMMSSERDASYHRPPFSRCAARWDACLRQHSVFEVCQAETRPQAQTHSSPEHQPSSRPSPFTCWLNTVISPEKCEEHSVQHEHTKHSKSTIFILYCFWMASPKLYYVDNGGPLIL